MFMPQLSLANKLAQYLLITAILTVSIIGCGPKQEAQQSTTPAPSVSTYVVTMDKVGEYREFVARTVASKEVELTARVEGELIARQFQEGAIVEQGQVLLKIDPTSYQTALESAKADLASRLAGAQGAARDLKRGREVAGQGYISQADLDKLITNDSQAKAAVKVAKANLEQAELNLSYTTIHAPFAGHVGKVNFNVGNIVNPASGAIATLTATDPMYVSFGVEESQFISYLQDKAAGQQDVKDELDISLRLPNNTIYPQAGEIIFADTKITQGMGTIELRAVFPNPDDIILPGLFVTLVAESKNKTDMALVPQASVQENQQGKFVLIVDQQNQVAQRMVTLGRRINAMWLVESGLKAGERVIIEGLQKVRNGIKVQPVEKRVDPVTGVIADYVR